MTPEQKQALIQCILQCPNRPWSERKTQTVPPEGPPDAQIAIIGRSPGVDEDRLGRPFVGKGGQALNTFLQYVGLNREMVWISNAAKCYGGSGDPPPPDEVYENCTHWVLEELDALKDTLKLIVVLGNDCYEWVAGMKGSVTYLQGEILPSRKLPAPIFPISHPGYWVRQKVYYHDQILGTIAPKLRVACQELGIPLTD
jgi:uracil-DNA glycosylase family 4